MAIVSLVVQIALIFIFHALLSIVQHLLLSFRCTFCTRAHYELDTLGIVGASGAGLDLGTTLLVVTHEKELVNAFTKRVVTIDKGRVVRDGMDGYYSYEA